MRKRLTIIVGGAALLLLCVGANISQWPFSPSPVNGWFLVWSNAVLTWTPDLSAGTGTISATIVGYATSNVLWLASSNLVYQGTNGLTTGAFTSSNTTWVNSSNLVYQGTN